VELRTHSLLLRPWRTDDAPALAAACDDPEIARWIPMIPSPYTEDDARAFLESSRQNYEAGESYNLAILDPESGALLGSVGMQNKRFHVGHFGYWIAREARGRGVATEALLAICRWAVAELGVQRLELVTDPANTASQRVADKAGFRREGVMRSALEYLDGTRRDSVMFSMLPEELGGL
jgi:RimJ/RimL family protein N-acetyltransferase